MTRRGCLTNVRRLDAALSGAESTGDTMRPLLLAALAAATVTPLAPAAWAHPSYHYSGVECDYVAISDGTSTPQTQWAGWMWVNVSAEDAAGSAAAVTIDAACELRLNLVAPGTWVLYTNTPGIGSAAAVQELTYYAHPTDVVTMCTHVTVAGEYHPC